MTVGEHDLYDRDEPALTGLERKLFDAVSQEEPWNLVETFADLERVSGSEDEERAAEYVSERLSALGIEHERYDPELWLSIPHDATLRATAPEEETFESAKTVSFSKDATTGGEVVHLESGGSGSFEDILDPDVDLDAVDEDLEGKVVVLEAMSLSIELISDLEEAGVAGFVGIHPHPDEPHEGIVTPIWGAAPTPDQVDEVPDLPIVNLSRRDGERLLELAASGDLELELETDLTRDWFACPLILARIEGGAAPDNDDFVLLHGHYDSWYEGVTDNATGDAGLLECARVFDDHSDHLQRDLWVAWWPGHSPGRYAGSTWFAERFAHELHDRCVAHVNMDSPGAKDATEFRGTLMWMPEADDLCRGAIEDVAGKEADPSRPLRAGDWSFTNLGVSGFFMLSSNIPAEVRQERGYHPVGGCGGNSDAWHLSTDTIDKADPEVLVRDIRVYVTSIVRVLDADVLPLDHRRTVERHLDQVAGYAEAAGDRFDLDPVLEELEALADTLERFHDAVERGEIEAPEADAAIKTLSRRLVPVGYVSEGRFEQDPAIVRPPYPSLEPATRLPDLDGDELRFQKVALRRERNEVVHELRQARRAVTSRLP